MIAPAMQGTGVGTSGSTEKSPARSKAFCDFLGKLFQSAASLGSLLFRDFGIGLT